MSNVPVEAHGNSGERLCHHYESNHKAQRIHAAKSSAI